LATRVELETLFPEGVRFKESGCPDFTPYAIKEVVLEGLTGKRKSDGWRATAESGLISKPDDYTWHHVEDGTTMQLIPKKLHTEVWHTGGASLLKSNNKNK
jgi:A nuclease of the HNH/ENDO VII superfamily with conserved WHH